MSTTPESSKVEAEQLTIHQSPPAQTVPIVVVEETDKQQPMEQIVTITHIIESSSSKSKDLSDSEFVVLPSTTPKRSVPEVARTNKIIPDISAATCESTTVNKEEVVTTVLGSSKVVSREASPTFIPPRVVSTDKFVGSIQAPLIRTNNSSLVISSAATPSVYNNTSSYEYKSTITPRPNVICRRPANNASTAVTTYTMNSNNGKPTPQQAIVLHQTQQREKQQLSELNDRFATYIERVRFLEVQNKYLDREVASLKAKLGLETKEIESMYKIELEAARSILDEVTDEHDSVRARLNKTENDLHVIRHRYAELNAQVANDRARIKTLLEQIAENESEAGLLRRRLADLSDEEKRLRSETHRMNGEIQRVTLELESEINQRIMLENDKQALEEQLAFIRTMHTRELDELKAHAFKDSGINPEEFFKNELANAIREIRKEYEAANHAQRAELDRLYRSKVADLRRQSVHALTAGPAAADAEQAKKLRSQIHETKRNVYDLRARVSFLFSNVQFSICKILS
jgi:hypothetical protein